MQVAYLREIFHSQKTKKCKHCFLNMWKYRQKKKEQRTKYPIKTIIPITCKNTVRSDIFFFFKPFWLNSKSTRYSFITRGATITVIEIAMIQGLARHELSVLRPIIGMMLRFITMAPHKNKYMNIGWDRLIMASFLMMTVRSNTTVQQSTPMPHRT